MATAPNFISPDFMNLDPVRSIAALSSRWRSRFWRSKESSPEHLRRGRRGEKLASRFLRGRGYKILYRNFKDRRGGEIDIVCRDGDSLVFVEVKTRGGEEFGRPIDAVDRQKQMRVSKGGLAWSALTRQSGHRVSFRRRRSVVARRRPIANRVDSERVRIIAAL